MRQVASMQSVIEAFAVPLSALMMAIIIPRAIMSTAIHIMSLPSLAHLFGFCFLCISISP